MPMARSICDPQTRFETVLRAFPNSPALTPLIRTLITNWREQLFAVHLKQPPALLRLLLRFAGGHSDEGTDLRCVKEHFLYLDKQQRLHPKCSLAKITTFEQVQNCRLYFNNAIMVIDNTDQLASMCQRYFLNQ